MKRREFVQAAVVIPTAAAIPLSPLPWWHTFRVALQQALVSSSLSPYFNQEVEVAYWDTFLGSDVRICRWEGPHLRNAPKLMLCCFVSFLEGEEATQVSTILNCLESRLTVIRSACERNYGSQGETKIGLSQPVFAWSDPDGSFYYPPGLPVVKAMPGYRGVYFSLQCQVACGA